MKNQEKISFAINQIAINNCDGSVNEKAIKAVRYLQEVHQALSQVAVISSVCDHNFKELQGSIFQCTKCFNVEDRL